MGHFPVRKLWNCCSRTCPGDVREHISSGDGPGKRIERGEFRPWVSVFDMKHKPISRRDFLKLAALGASSFSLYPLHRTLDALLQLPEFPQAERLGRAARGSLEIKARPDPDSQTVGLLYEDNVAPWLREVVGEKINWAFNNQRWVEVPDGYVYGQFFQPVWNRPNQPVESLPDSSLGPGMWVEVTVPYVDVTPQNEPSKNSWVESLVEDGLPVRLYYSQIFWVDQIRKNSLGQTLYRVNPNYYGGLDLLWGPAEAFRPIPPEELMPIRPEAEDKRIEIDITYQTLSCYEGDTEVYFCRVSTGAMFNSAGQAVDNWLTPLGNHRITRKYISLQMSSATTGASYDSPGIGWSIIFATGGVAIHSTYWHNGFGDPLSHGCVNVPPEDAKWIFRWTSPHVAFDPGALDVTLTGQSSTSVKVVAS